MIGIVKNIPMVHKIITLAATFVVAVFVAGAYFSGILALPEDVQALEVKVETNIEAIHDLTEQSVRERNLMLRMLCNQDPEESWESCERQYGGVGGAF